MIRFQNLAIFGVKLKILKKMTKNSIVNKIDSFEPISMKF